jgi:protein-S-isoprenylcysteine O-methyltransferase Ste14
LKNPARNYGVWGTRNWVRQIKESNEMANDDKPASIGLTLIKFVDAGYFLAIAVWIAWETPVGIRYVIGMTIGAVGFVLWMWARQQLGRSFTVTAQARALVTTGLYSKIRNPIYFFGGVAFLGVFIAWGNLYALGGFLVLYFAMQGLRARKESSVLEDAFGDEYRRYKAQTWF